MKNARSGLIMLAAISSMVAAIIFSNRIISREPQMNFRELYRDNFYEGDVELFK